MIRHHIKLGKQILAAALLLPLISASYKHQIVHLLAGNSAHMDQLVISLLNFLLSDVD
jgi:hypothetical protein